MAKIHEEVVVIKLSKLVKNDQGQQPELVGGEIVAALEQVVQELVGEGVVVEVEAA